MGKSHRAERLGEEIRRVTGELLLNEIKDPRLHRVMTGVSSVDISPDGRYATRYILLLTDNYKDDEANAEIKKDVINALNGAKGLIKNELSKRVRVRYMPEISFKIDDSMDYGSRIDELLNEVAGEE